MAGSTGIGTGRRTRRGRVVVAAVAAMTVGFSGAAVIDAWFLSPRLAMADELGPGDGLTRLVVRADGGVTAEQVAALGTLPAVDSAQPLFDGSALVAGTDITAADVQTVVPGAEVELSVPGETYGLVVSDPFWGGYGWNLENTGSNVYGGGATAGADVSAPAGWQAGTGRGLVVAVADSGYALSHPDMAGALWTNPDESCGSSDADGNGKPGDCHGWNFYRNTSDITNGGDNAHGTAVSGIVGARAANGEGSAGVAPDVTIMPLVIGAGKSVDLYAGAQAIRYAADNGADVVNASWGTVQDDPGAASILTAAIAYADSKGVVVVTAAGNDSLDRDTQRRYPASLDQPNLITVGSSTAADRVAGHSAYGDATVDLFAPGQRIMVHDNSGGYGIGDGTSYASPHVAAAVALYKAQDRTATPAELKAALLADVQYLPAFAGKSVTGGRLALDDLGNTAAPVSYVFSAMSADAGPVAPRVVATGSAPAGAYEVAFGLGMEHGGQVYALTGQDITLGGVTATTDDDGAATFSLGTRPGLGSVALSPTTELAEGRYVLTARVLRDGSPLGLAYAAPLLVGDEARATAPQPGTGTPGTPVPDDEEAGGADPDTGTATPAPGTGTPGTGTGPAPGSGTPPRTGTPGPVGPAPDAPGAIGTPAPDTDDRTGTPAPQTPATDGGSGAPAPGATGPGTTTPGTTGPGTGTPTPGATDPGASDPGASDPGTPPATGGRKDYPETGPFRLTSISPTVVSAAGGTRVVITGLAIPEGALVRVGSTGGAQVDEVSPTRLTFTTPALVAGRYDVYVFSPDRSTSSRLDAALTYVAGGSGPTPGTNPQQPGGSTQPDPDGTAPGVPDPGATDPGTTGPGATDPGATDPSTGGSAGGGVVTGPNGERLRYSARFASLGASIWGIDCSTGCSGLAL
ncbi:S8 family serine peptidase [Geodermatophilus sabuli]|uniref:S8 family serine peptidase n=1 Tax=Geodermatophilus sabuli TaxID=1564158 RepID=A0A7K3VYP2_9ACTN|nr:S8 family serine peptidase [Geodermatophilus sabuli]NEK57233.1 S8 family serine peptidase [Geodermatophilus sabuli]